VHWWTPPYKNFTRKTEFLPVDPDPKGKATYIFSSFYNRWAVRCVGVDSKKGLCVLISSLEGSVLDVGSLQEVKVGQFYLPPSPILGLATWASGHVQLLVVTPSGVSLQYYFEKIPANGFGLGLHFAAEGKAFCEIFRKKPSLFTQLWPAIHHIR
jgi:hypothetical protein